MKNIIISSLLTYIFYSKCEIQLWYLIPAIFIVFWLIVAEVDEVYKDYKRTLKRGRHLQQSIRRAERGW